MQGCNLALTILKPLFFYQNATSPPTSPKYEICHPIGCQKFPLRPQLTKTFLTIAWSSCILDDKPLVGFPVSNFGGEERNVQELVFGFK